MSTDDPEHDHWPGSPCHAERSPSRKALVVCAQLTLVVEEETVIPDEGKPYKHFVMQKPGAPRLGRKAFARQQRTLDVRTRRGVRSRLIVPLTKLGACVLVAQ